MGALHKYIPYYTSIQPLYSEPQSAGVSIIAIDTGYRHTCALASSGGLWCWGWNAYGQLGINNTADQSSPVAVSLGAGGCAVVL